jgi:hypothetical protein
MATQPPRRARERSFTWDKAASRFVPEAGSVEYSEMLHGRPQMEARQSRSRFLKGPIPWSWIIRASELPGKALVIGLCLWRLSGAVGSKAVGSKAVGSKAVTLGNAELEPFGSIVPQSPGRLPRWRMHDLSRLSANVGDCLS